MAWMLTTRLNIRSPIIQAPMAGVSSPAMAAAVTNAGALGSIAVGAVTASLARKMIGDVRARTDGPFNVNLFCHAPAQHDAAIELAWLERLRPAFAAMNAVPPAGLRQIYRSFVADDDMLATLVAERPPVVSFHFGSPSASRIAALRDAGIVLLGCATSLAEARVLAAAGVDAVVAQGFEAGGHRGVFDPKAADDLLSTHALTRLLVRSIHLPIIAAGGIMDGAGISAALRLGAAAAQLGTAFIPCTESLADTAYRSALASEAAQHTLMTNAISGRPARCLPNRFTALGLNIPPGDIPAYPIAYDAGKALNEAGKAAGENGYGAHWAGQGAPLARSRPAGRLIAEFMSELAGPAS